MIQKKIDFLFFSESIRLKPFLEEIDSQHVVRVLRKRVGDEIMVTDGLGALFHCQIIDANPKKCALRIVEIEENYKPLKRNIHVAICPTKNMDRIEYFLEKSVEIGISSIFFVFSQNTYPKKINMERMRKIAISAMKQSIKTNLPILHEPLKFDEFLKKTKDFENKFIAHLDGSFVDINSLKMQKDMLMLIGPEGDFSEKEIINAKENGFKTVKMGESRLRTETAAVVAVSLLNMLP